VRGTGRGGRRLFKRLDGVGQRGKRGRRGHVCVEVGEGGGGLARRSAVGHGHSARRLRRQIGRPERTMPGADAGSQAGLDALCLFE
jgi:hypothetical protein